MSSQRKSSYINFVVSVVRHILSFGSKFLERKTVHSRLIFHIGN